MNVLLSIAALASLQTPPALPAREVCQLISADEIRVVQDSPVTARKHSFQRRRDLDVAQCFFTASDFARSVSLTVISGASGQVRRYWRTTFERDDRAAENEKEKEKENGREEGEGPARMIPRTGDEAFYSGDASAGALYVLTGDLILRISVGGTRDEEERIRRSTALAQAAIHRLKQTS